MPHLDLTPYDSARRDVRTRFGECPPGCNPDFDADLGEPERDFAELRLRRMKSGRRP